MTPRTLMLHSGVAVTFDADNAAHLSEVGLLLKRRGHGGCYVVEATTEPEPVEVEGETVKLDLQDAVFQYDTSLYLTDPESVVVGIFNLDADLAANLAEKFRMHLDAWVQLANRAHVEVTG